MGSQLLEFAIAVPFLLVLVIGAIDFGSAYNVKHILTNAAREGARITVSNSLTNISCTDTTPCSIQAAADAVKQYLSNAGLTQASCITPNGLGAGPVWAQTCNGVTLSIDHNVVITGGPGGTVIPSSRVQLSYPYTFTFGRVIGLVGGSGPNGQQTITASVTMQNMIN